VPLDQAATEGTVQGERLARALSRSVFIATPIARAPCRQYTMALVQTFALLLRLGIRGYMQTVVGSSNLPRARNELVAAFLASDYDDLLFIDDDMGWEPPDVVRLLASDRAIIGGVGAKKKPLADTNPAKWCLHRDPAKPFRQDDFGAIEVDGIGTGFVKISRSIFAAWIAAYPERKRRGWDDMPEDARRQYYGFFRFPDEYDEPGEDFAFCRDLRALGLAIWVDPTIRLVHVGECEYGGDFTALLCPAPDACQTAGDAARATAQDEPDPRAGRAQIKAMMEAD
jgi:hypothetical protein